MDCETCGKSFKNIYNLRDHIEKQKCIDKSCFEF